MAASLLVSIDRADMGLDPLVMSGASDTHPLGIINFTEPAAQARVVYAEDSDFLHGSLSTSAVLQQALMSFDLAADVGSETELRNLLRELKAALMRQTYLTTVTINDAPSDTWRCDMGSVIPPPRALEDLENHDPVWSVTIPCYPIPGG